MLFLLPIPFFHTFHAIINNEKNLEYIALRFFVKIKILTYLKVIDTKNTSLEDIIFFVYTFVETRIIYNIVSIKSL